MVLERGWKIPMSIGGLPGETYFCVRRETWQWLSGGDFTTWRCWRTKTILRVLRNSVPQLYTCSPDLSFQKALFHSSPAKKSVAFKMVAVENRCFSAGSKLLCRKHIYFVWSFCKKAIRNAAVHQLALKLGEEHFQSLFWTTSML